MSHGSVGEIQLENEHFRVTKWTIHPDGVIPMHRHDHEYVVVPMMTGSMHVRNSDGSEIHANLVTGETYTREAGSEHEVSNPGGSAPVVFVEVEKLSS